MNGFGKIGDIGLQLGECFRIMNDDDAYVFLRRMNREVTTIKISGKEKNMYHILHPDLLVKRLRVRLTQRVK